MPALMVRGGVSRSDVLQWLGPTLMVVMGLGGAGCGKSQRDFDTDGSDALGNEPDAAITPDAGTGDPGTGDPGTGGPGTGSETQPNATGGDDSGSNAGSSSGHATSSEVPSGPVSTDAVSDPGGSQTVATSETSEDVTGVTGGDTGNGSSEPGADTSGDDTGAQTGPDTTAPRCNENILLNGDFESGKDHWSFTSNFGAFEQRVHPVIVENGHESLTDYSVTAYSGTQFAFLGDIPDDEYMGYGLRLAQPVYIPEDALGLVLKGQVWVSSDEPTDVEYDYGYIELQPIDDSEKVAQFKFWTNRNPMTEWADINEYIENLDLVRGKTVDFVVQAEMDADTATRFWFDDLELIVVCPE